MWKLPEEVKPLGYLTASGEFICSKEDEGDTPVYLKATVEAEVRTALMEHLSLAWQAVSLLEEDKTTCEITILKAMKVIDEVRSGVYKND